MNDPLYTYLSFKYCFQVNVFICVLLSYFNTKCNNQWYLFFKELDNIDIIICEKFTDTKKYISTYVVCATCTTTYYF